MRLYVKVTNNFGEREKSLAPHSLVLSELIAMH